MANTHTGKFHSHGFVKGSFIYAIIGVVAAFILFNMYFMFGIAAICFSLTNIVFGLHSLFFGGNIKHSLRKKKKDYPVLYTVLSLLRWIFFILFIFMVLISIGLLLV